MMAALSRQDYDGPWEVIVVDNGSRAGVVSRRAATHSACLPLKIVTASRKANGSYARNEGVKAAAGDKLLFLDADDEIEPDYVRTMAVALDADDYVTSRVDSVTLNAPWVREAQGAPWDGRLIVFFGFMPATGINIGIRRRLFEASGGFPEEFPASQDIAFSWRAQLNTGVTIRFVPEAVYKYRYRESLWALYRQTVNWGRSNALLFRTFRNEGMPARPVKQALGEWSAVLRSLVSSRSKADLAPVVVRLGYCVGRLRGSVQYCVLFL